MQFIIMICLVIYLICLGVQRELQKTTNIYDDDIASYWQLTGYVTVCVIMIFCICIKANEK